MTKGQSQDGDDESPRTLGTLPEVYWAYSMDNAIVIQEHQVGPVCETSTWWTVTVLSYGAEVLGSGNLCHHYWSDVNHDSEMYETLYYITLCGAKEGEREHRYHPKCGRVNIHSVTPSGNYSMVTMVTQDCIVQR